MKRTADRTQTIIDFDRAGRDRLGEQLAAAIVTLDLIRPDENGRRLTSATTAAAVFRELANMIGAKECFRVKVETIAGRLGRNRSAITRALGLLVELGIVIHSRTGRSSLYSIDWPAVRRITTEAAARRSSAAAASAHGAPSAGALCAISSRTVRHQIAHGAPSTPPANITQEPLPPPPPNDGRPVGRPSAWIEAEQALERAGVGAVGAAITIARERGYAAEQVAQLAELVAEKQIAGVRAYGPGAVFSRLKNGTPRQPLDVGLPDPSTEYQQAAARRLAIERQAARERAERDAAAAAAEQAAELERRLGARLDAMGAFERERLAITRGRSTVELFRRDPTSPTVRRLLLRAIEESPPAT